MGKGAYIGQEYEVNVGHVDSGVTNNAACDMVVGQCTEFLRIVGNLFDPEILFFPPKHLENGRAYRYRYVILLANRETYAHLGLHVLSTALRIYARMVSKLDRDRRSGLIDDFSQSFSEIELLRGKPLSAEENRRIQSTPEPILHRAPSKN